MLFSRCVATLFNPIHRRERGVKWGLVSYAVVMFSTATILTGIGFNDQSNSYIDNREFPGVRDALPPGPLGYQSFTFSDTLPVVASFMFFLNGWLADGLLVCLIPCSSARVLTPALLALSLLCHLLHEPLGHRLPLPHVPRFIGHVL